MKKIITSLLFIMTTFLTEENVVSILVSKDLGLF